MAVLTAFSVAAAMIAVYVRGTIATEMYLSSENYLSDGKENRRPAVESSNIQSARRFP